MEVARSSYASHARDFCSSQRERESHAVPRKEDTELSGGTGDVVQLVQCLLRTGRGMHTSIPHPCEAEVESSEIQGHPQLHRECADSWAMIDSPAQKESQEEAGQRC